MKNSLLIKKKIYMFFKMIKKLLTICFWIYVTIGVLYIWSVFQEPEAIEVPPGMTVRYLTRGDCWLISQEFVVIYAEGIWGSKIDWGMEYDWKHPLEPKIVKEIVDKEKNAKTELNTDKYTQEQKKSTHVLYQRKFYKETMLTPRTWNGKKTAESFEYEDRIITSTSGSVRGLDEIE